MFLLLALALGAAPLHLEADRYSLPNGLTVILHEDHRVPVVVVDLWYRVGSKEERVGATGFAHLFEHLMFMGTRNVPNGKFDAIMEAQGGSNNASTSEDRTNYFESGPSNLLETFLWLEADRLASLADEMTPEKVDLQREVVKNERRQSYENRPYGQVDLLIPEKLFPAGHPYHHPIIGSHADLTAASVADVKAFFRTFYVPANASLVISGDFSGADAKRLVERYFGWMPRSPQPRHASAKPASLAQSVRAVLVDQVSAEQVNLAWHSPPAFTEGDSAADLLAELLGTGQSSRLYEALVHGKKLAQSVKVEQRGAQEGSTFVITGTAQAGHTAAELEQAIDAELEGLKVHPPTDAEVDRARALQQMQLLQQLDSPFGVAEALNEAQFYLGDAGKVSARFLGRYDGVTTKDLRRYAQTILGSPRVVISVVAPAGPP